jgi:hypothetical protein
VSLPSFQRALCDLIASPNLCLALRADPDATLAAYDVSPRERARLVEVVWQRGMSTNCTLYRSNRITPIFTMLNYTCLALGAQFAGLIEEFWDAKAYRDNQFQSEVERFGAFLRRHIAEGAVESPYAGELLAFELAKNALEFSPRKAVLRELAGVASPGSDTRLRLHPLARIVRFDHDPGALLVAAAEGALPTPDLPPRETFVVLSVADGALTAMQLLDEADDGSAPPHVEPPLAPFAGALARAGLLVPWAFGDASRAAATR